MVMGEKLSGQVRDNSSGSEGSESEPLDEMLVLISEFEETGSPLKQAPVDDEDEGCWPSPLSIGQTVSIEGLTNAKQDNGRIGCIVSIELSRCGV